MAKNNIEQVVVSKIIEDGAMTGFLDVNITALFFTNERWQKAYSWIYEYQSKHGEIPKPSAFARAHPNAELLDTVEDPVTALCEEMLDRRKRSLWKEGLQAAVDAYDQDSIDESMAAVLAASSSIGTEISRSTVVRSSDFIGSSIQETLTQLDNRLPGIPTGFPTIDEAAGGMQDEQLIFLIANPKSGKSSLSLAMALAAQRYGKRGLYITWEMSNREVQQRYLSLGAEVNLTSILRHQVSEEGVKRLRKFEEEVLDMPDLMLVHDTSSTMTVGGIKAKNDQFQPDYLVIDGVYLLQDELGRDPGSPQALTNISRSLKRLAASERIPVVATTQALLSRTSKRLGLQLGSIGYSSAFAQDADVVIGLDRPDLTKPESKLKIIAARNALGVEVDLLFDYSRGLIEENGGAMPFRTAIGMNTAVSDDD